MTHPVAGDTVVITGIMPNDPAPLEIGDRGKVITVFESGQVEVDWESGRSLLLLLSDPFTIEKK